MAAIRTATVSESPLSGEESVQSLGEGDAKSVVPYWKGGDVTGLMLVRFSDL